MVRAHDEAKADQMDLERQAKEPFEVLAMTTEGEAKLMVRNVTSQGGILAWRRLYSYHNRRTMARWQWLHLCGGAKQGRQVDGPCCGCRRRRSDQL